MRLFALILLTAIAPVLIPDIDPNMQRTPEFDRWWTDQSRDVTREYLDHWETAPQWQKDLLLEKEWKR